MPGEVDAAGVPDGSAKDSDSPVTGLIVVRRHLRRRWLRLAVCISALAAVFAATAYRAALRGDAARFDFDASGAVHVERAIDGDTLLLASGHRVRLLGVDTPETKHPTRGVEPWGPQASEFTRRQAAGRDAVLEFDRERTDRYDRVLAWVWVDGRLLNEELVRGGYSAAVLISPLRPDLEKRLVAAEADARESRRGIWSLP